jgi:hypothetical protein
MITIVERKTVSSLPGHQTTLQILQLAILLILLMRKHEWSKY